MSSKKRRLARGVALALAVLLMLPVRTLATTIDEVQNRQEELKQENEDLQAKIDALKEDEEAALAYQEELTGKIDENEQKIDQARATIEEMNGKIKELEARISLSEEKYQGTIDAFKERLKALYVSGGSSLGTLEILLDSESLSEFFTRQELVEVMAQRDQSMLDQLDAYMEETQGDREELVVAQQEVADSKKAIEAAWKASRPRPKSRSLPTRPRTRSCKPSWRPSLPSATGRRRRSASRRCKTSRPRTGALTGERVPHSPPAAPV